MENQQLLLAIINGIFGLAIVVLGARWGKAHGAATKAVGQAEQATQAARTIVDAAADGTVTEEEFQKIVAAISPFLPKKE